MRFEGTLRRWDDAKGYGFIEPHQGGQDLFVHISDMRHLGQRPMIGECWTFEVRQGADGKKRAADVRRWQREPVAGQVRRQDVRSGRAAVRPRGRGTAVAVLVVALAVAAGWGFNKGLLPWRHASPPAETPLPLVAAPAPAPEAPAFQCDGRTLCTEMRSCEEATYFLQHCPGAQMDGDHDGVACEQQWCGR